LSVQILAESIATPGDARPPNTHSTNDALEDCLPHDMSYLTRKMLQYGGTPAQESHKPLPHIPADMWMIWVQNESEAANYPVLTVGRGEIKYVSVPPGEAAQCFFGCAIGFLAAKKLAQRPRI
jgi:hypothetical protein